MDTNPYSSPESPGELPKQKDGRLTSTLMKVFTGLGILVVLIAMLLPSLRLGAGPSARRVMCSNNLKQLALALQLYQDDHQALPPAYTVDADGKPLHSWRTLILPYLQMQSLYDAIDLSKAWDDPANKLVFDTHLATYHCSAVDFPLTHTTYLAVVAPNGSFRAIEPRPLAEITDNRDLTLMVVEVDASHAVHWMSPMDASQQVILDLANLAKTPHPEGFHAATVTGRIVTVNRDSKPATLRALISIDGNDDATAAAAIVPVSK